jgi:hypothetical protein
VRRDRLAVGDLVEVDVRGRKFSARVVDTDPQGWAPEFLEVDPTNPGARGYHFVTVRQVRKRLERAPRARRAAA